MNKSTIFGTLAVLAIGIAIYAFTRPEPTPEERLSEAAVEAANAVDEAVTALSDAAQEAGEAAAEELQNATNELQESAASAAAELMEQVNSSAQETKQGLLELIEAWKASGIVSEDGIDFDKAIATIEGSNLSVDAKSQAEAIIIALRDAPDLASKKLSELEAALSQ